MKICDWLFVSDMHPGGRSCFLSLWFCTKEADFFLHSCSSCSPTANRRRVNVKHGPSSCGSGGNSPHSSFLWTNQVPWTSSETGGQTQDWSVSVNERGDGLSWSETSLISCQKVSSASPPSAVWLAATLMMQAVCMLEYQLLTSFSSPDEWGFPCVTFFICCDGTKCCGHLTVSCRDQFIWMNHIPPVVKWFTWYRS